MRIDRSNLKNRGIHFCHGEDVLLSGRWFHVVKTTPQAIFVRPLISYLAEHPDYEAKNTERAPK